MVHFFLFFILFISTSLSAESSNLPVMHQGRIKPLASIKEPFNEKMLVVPLANKNQWASLDDLKNHQNKNISTLSDATYFQLAEAIADKNIDRAQNILASNYEPTWRFKAEKFYTSTPLIPITVGLYSLALLFFLFNRMRTGLIFFGAAFLIHTSILALRSYILMRPPVSNMGETVIYVPWIAALLAGIITFYTKESLPALVGALMAAILLLTPINEGLENLQPVLNSTYWLVIHVLMIVASYGVLIFAGLLGHIYLFNHNKTAAKLLLPTLYAGVALLIPGTILGGVWAAESWGRFWDWDPKEAWAFISAAIYLAIIHARRFGKINDFGLAIGSVIGLLAISFTWYGVNYILGTGLHSYGFGNGGEYYYFAFVAIEFLIIAASLIINHLKINANYDNN